MKLLNQTTLGNLKLKNSLAMSAMTRSRANINGMVGDLHIQYYTQRASAGLIFTEAINISEQAIGSPFTPGIYSEEQIEAWRKVTDAVHDRGGIIVAQLWHTGRAGHSVDRKGILPVAPSAVAINGSQHFTSQGPKEYEAPQALSVEEIKQIVKDYGHAAENAMTAGFDGVELHAANGYLPNQFLADNANQRTDEYGGSIQNKTRFILEVMKELINTVGGDKVGIKLSPFHPYGDILFDNPVATFTYLIEELNKLDFSYVELMKRSPMFPVAHYPKDDEIELFGKQIKHVVIANTGYDKVTAEAELEKGIAKLVSFGTLFLANPDLPQRFEKDAPLNQPDRATMFGGGYQGYIDYPFLEEPTSILHS
ncbi:alkene reductase [Desertivirga arenae]|uniref:alkene reductase n=1 Tax=Desertivirga arenae TaxID=2810309 RepID=UPI001A964C22|nr:alkene reductase [Pedobacter sp. SYSU D00823]